jgi:hypothetical protein
VSLLSPSVARSHHADINLMGWDWPAETVVSRNLTAYESEGGFLKQGPCLCCACIAAGGRGACSSSAGRVQEEERRRRARERAAGGAS